MANPNATSLSLPGVPDILYHVFAYLDPIHQDQYPRQVYESRRSLALASRTCRAFTGPALDVLWKRLPDDQPLADLLCAVGIATREADEKQLESLGGHKPGRYMLPNQGSADFCRPDVAEEYERRWRLSRGYDVQYHLRDIGDPRKHPGWPRFVEYASRVHTITLFAFDGPAWCGLWEELRSRTDHAPILPRLLTVAFCSISKRNVAPETLELISPSVCKLNFNFGDEFPWSALREKLSCLFSQTFISAPEIDQLRLALHPSCIGSPLLRTHCARVHRLEIYPQLSLDELRLLTEFPALQHLSISLSRKGIPEGTPSFVLKSITTLDVKGTWIDLGTLLDTVRFPSLHTLSATGWVYGEPAAELAKGATQYFRTLAARHPSLTSLSIFATHGRMPPPRGCILSNYPVVKDTFETPFLDLVHPILSLSALRHLSLSLLSYFEVTYTTDDLRAVAESFRALEALHLFISPYPFGAAARKGTSIFPYRGPLDAIAHFARNCPRLRLLHLPGMELEERSLALALAAIGDADNSGEHPRERHGLRTLVIPRVLLPPGRADLAGKVLELVRGVFPLAACSLRPQFVIKEDVDRVVVDRASWQCPECISPWRLSSFSW